MKKKSAPGLALTGSPEATMGPWAGIAPLIETARQIRMTSKAEKVLPFRKTSKGLTWGQMVEAFVLLSALVDECLEDMGRLRRDEALPYILGYNLPAPETARQWLDRFDDEDLVTGQALQGCFLPGETAPLGGLGEVRRHVVRAYVQNVKVEERVTPDIDAHLVETGKSGTCYCYEGYKAFQLTEVCWAETGLVLSDEFQEGNAPASEGNRRLVDEATRPESGRKWPKQPG